MTPHETVTRDQLIEAVGLVMASLTNTRHDGAIDRLLGVVEGLHARLQVVELELQHLRASPPDGEAA